jgi:hypothetical protein
MNPSDTIIPLVAPWKKMGGNQNNYNALLFTICTSSVIYPTICPREKFS